MRGVRATGPLQVTLQRATFVALKKLVDLCLQERVHFLVLAGDLFDVKDRSIAARLTLQSELARLSAVGIETFIVHGNHDPLEATAAMVAPLAKHVHVFGTEWAEVGVVREGRVVARVQGISYGRERVEENLSRHFSRRGPEATVGVLHANVGGQNAHANYAPCSIEDLDARGLTYWALGHLHTKAVHELPRGGVAVYPGNLQGRHVLEDGERGCFLVDVDEDRSALRFVPLDEVRWHRVTLSVDAFSGVEELEEGVSEALSERCRAPQAAHAVRLVLEGRGAVHAELRKPGAREQLEEHLREALSRRPVPVVLESLEDATRPALDWETLRASNGLPADVLRASEEAVSLASVVGGDKLLKALEGALRKVGVTGFDPLAPALVEDAAVRAVELLVSEEA